MRDGLVFTSVLHVPPQGWEKAMRETASTAVRISVGDCHLGVEDSLFELGGVTIVDATAWTSVGSISKLSGLSSEGLRS